MSVCVPYRHALDDTTFRIALPVPPQNNPHDRSSTAWPNSYGCAVQLQQVDRDRVRPGPDHGDSGALTGRELLRRSRVARFLAKGLPDKRDGCRIRHSQRRLARTLLRLAGQGRREHGDAAELRDDPALRLATGDRAGTAPLDRGRLPSQPTLSRRVAAWSAKEGVEVLVLERAERHLCGKAAVRFDAGYPGEPLMAALEERGTHYVARVRNNAVLKRLALPAMDAVVWDALNNGAPAGGEPRAWVRESSYRAGSWSRSRRVVQVVVERPGELIHRCFWLLTSMSSEEMSGEDLLALYRKRGKAEGHLGELMSVVSPAPRNACFLAPGTAPTRPRGLREAPQPPTLPLTRRFMNEPG